MSPSLLAVICCPETHQALAAAETELVDSMNARVCGGTARTSGGKLVEEPIEAALVRADGKVAYRVRDGIPILLAEEGIAI